MNSEGITLRVLKPTFLPSTKGILNVHVLKINTRKKRIPQFSAFYRVQCVREVDWDPTKPFIPCGFYMWTQQLKSMSLTTQPNNIKRHNLLILRRLMRAYFRLRQCSKQQQQFLCLLRQLRLDPALLPPGKERERRAWSCKTTRRSLYSHPWNQGCLSLPKEGQTTFTGCEHFAPALARCSPPTSMTFAGESFHLPNPRNHSAVGNSAQLHCLYFPFPPAPSFTFFHRSVKPSQQWLIVMEQSHPSVSTA